MLSNVTPIWLEWVMLVYVDPPLFIYKKHKQEIHITLILHQFSNVFVCLSL